MIENKPHIRILRPSGLYSISVGISGTPAVQSLSADRGSNPTIINPIVNKTVSGTETKVNASLSNIGWSVDGMPISVAWTDGYSIDQSGENKGQLTITKNIEANKYYSLVFTCVYSENGKTYTLSSESISVGCSSNQESQYKASCSHSQAGYSEQEDKLLLHEYMQANLIEPESDLTEYEDGKSYMMKAKVLLSKGAASYSELPDNITMSVYVNGVKQEVNTFSSAWLLKADYPDIWIDMRLINTLQAEIRFEMSGSVIASTYLTSKRKYYDTTITKPSGGFDVSDKSQLYEDEIDLYNTYRKVEYPELHYDLTWTNQSGNEVGYGKKISSSSYSLGLTKRNLVEINISAKERGALSPIIDENNVFLTDENGSKLIL